VGVRYKPVGAILDRTGKGEASGIVYAYQVARLVLGGNATGGSGDRLMSRPPPAVLARARRALPTIVWIGERPNGQWTMIDETEVELAAARPDRSASVRLGVALGASTPRHTKRLNSGVRSATTDAILSAPGQRAAAWMRTPRRRHSDILGASEAAPSITLPKIERFLSRSRSVGPCRQRTRPIAPPALATGFEYAWRGRTRFALPPTLCRGARKSASSLHQARPTLTADKILALARAASAGRP